MISRSDLLARAHTALNKRTVYTLGGGADSPELLDPRDSAGGCDCSAFVCWALGLKKFDRGRKWLAAVNGGYLSTDGLWWDAVKTEMGIFNLVSWISGIWNQTEKEKERQPGLTRCALLAKPGDLIVYPAAWVVRGANVGATRVRADNPPVGHVAIVVDPAADSPLVIDCSSGNFRRTGDAIQEHRWFPQHPAAVVARCVLVTD